MNAYQERIANLIIKFGTIHERLEKTNEEKRKLRAHVVRCLNALRDIDATVMCARLPDGRVLTKAECQVQDIARKAIDKTLEDFS